MKRWLKRALLASAPKWTTQLLSARARAHSHRMVREWGLADITEKLLATFGPVVQSGPFRGMTLGPMTHREHLGPFLLGTYEAELHPWFDSTEGNRYAQIIDVGSSFGYYAVGLARIFPNIPLIAFDTDWWARAATREMAIENRTPNVKVAGFCSPAWLDQSLRPKSLVMCDCEGYEGELLTRTTSPSLNSATLIVETHEEACPGVTDRIRRRFAETHLVSTVTANLDSVPVPPVDLSFLTLDEARLAIREVRGPQTWLLLTPEASSPR